MFEAWLIICNIYIPTACIELQDTRGPYLTEALCENRIEEMRKDVVELNYIGLASRCITPTLGVSI